MCLGGGLENYFRRVDHPQSHAEAITVPFWLRMWSRQHPTLRFLQRADGPRRRALLLYATFKATNAARNGQVMNTSDAWQQAFKEGAASRPDLRILIGRT